MYSGVAVGHRDGEECQSWILRWCPDWERVLRSADRIRCKCSVAEHRLRSSVAKMVR